MSKYPCGKSTQGQYQVIWNEKLGIENFCELQLFGDKKKSEKNEDFEWKY